MSEVYHDSWLVYKNIYESTRKKFLKKPNYSQALAEYNSLSARFRDEECHIYAAFCHVQIAAIHEILSDWSQQYTHLLKAARLFVKAEELDAELCTAVSSDCVNVMQDCFNKATKLIFEKNGVWLAGLHQTELGNCLYKLGHARLALKYLSRGVRLLEVEHFSRLAALAKLAECQVELGLYTDAIGSIDELWATHMKCAPNPSFGYGKDLLKDCEISCVLLLIRNRGYMMASETSPRHRLLLSMYSECNGEQQNKRSPILSADEFPLKDSALSRDQFIHFFDFIVAIQKGDTEKAKTFFVKMKPYLNDMCCKIATELICITRNNGCV